MIPNVFKEMVLKAVQENMYSQMWEAGYTECLKGGKCNLRPCTVSQKVLCCKECKYGCSSKCKKVEVENE